MEIKNSGTAVIENGAIVIRVALEHLPIIVGNGGDAMGVDLKLIDADIFANELVRELNREKEDGTTPIHTMFDHCIMEAFEAGAEGIEEAAEEDDAEDGE